MSEFYFVEKEMTTTFADLKIGDFFQYRGYDACVKVNDREYVILDSCSRVKEHVQVPEALVVRRINLDVKVRVQKIKELDIGDCATLVTSDDDNVNSYVVNELNVYMILDIGEDDVIIMNTTSGEKYPVSLDAICIEHDVECTILPINHTDG